MLIIINVTRVKTWTIKQFCFNQVMDERSFQSSEVVRNAEQMKHSYQVSVINSMERLDYLISDNQIKNLNKAQTWCWDDSVIAEVFYELTMMGQNVVLKRWCYAISFWRFILLHSCLVQPKKKLIWKPKSFTHPHVIAKLYFLLFLSHTQKFWKLFSVADTININYRKAS